MSCVLSDLLLKILYLEAKPTFVKNLPKTSGSLRVKMAFGVMHFYAFLNPYHVPYLFLKSVGVFMRRLV